VWPVRLVVGYTEYKKNSPADQSRRIFCSSHWQIERRLKSRHWGLRLADIGKFMQHVPTAELCVHLPSYCWTKPSWEQSSLCVLSGFQYRLSRTRCQKQFSSVIRCLFLNADFFCSIRLLLNTDPTCRQRLRPYDRNSINIIIITVVKPHGHAISFTENIAESYTWQLVFVTIANLPFPIVKSAGVKDEESASCENDALYYLCRGGYVFTLFVCLFVVGWQDYAKTTLPIFTKFGERWHVGHRRNH